MEDDDEIQSNPSPAPNGRIAVTVATVSAAASVPPPPSNSLTLALPIQHHHKTPSSGGGREDCWSEDATAVLIDAWGERYLELSRGNLKQKHWKDVADIVSSREDYTKPPKTDIQCKNRIDTVKKKYKVERTKIATGGGPSKWRFFDKLDELIGTTAAKISSTPPSADMYQKVPLGIPLGVRSSSSAPQDRFRIQNKPSRRRPPVDSDGESEPENSVDSSDGLPPETRKRPRRMVNTNEKSDCRNKESSSNSSSNWGNSMRELSGAILKFGEAYEQAESAKLQQLVEMEKQRMKFAKDLELQRMQYFMKTQLELSQLRNRRRRPPGTNNIHHGNGISNAKNSDSSSN